MSVEELYHAIEQDVKAIYAKRLTEDEFFDELLTRLHEGYKKLKG